VTQHINYSEAALYRFRQKKAKKGYKPSSLFFLGCLPAEPNNTFPGGLVLPSGVLDIHRTGSSAGVLAVSVSRRLKWSVVVY